MGLETLTINRFASDPALYAAVDRRYLQMRKLKIVGIFFIFGVPILVEVNFCQAEILNEG